MKRIAILISVLFVIASIEVKAQGSNSVNLNVNEWKFDYNGNANDTIGDNMDNNTANWTNTVYVGWRGDPLKYKIYMDVDSTDGTSSAADEHLFILQAKSSNDETYTALDTVSYAGTADTTFTFTQVTTAQFYKWWRVLGKTEDDGFDSEIKVVNWAFYK